MDKSYVQLFTEIARTSAVSAEQVMDYDHEKGDEEGFKVAMTMRDDFEQVRERIEQGTPLSKNDFTKLLAGAMIIVNQLQDRITTTKKAIAGYQTDVMPKLQRIINECQSDEEVTKLANELFVV